MARDRAEMGAEPLPTPTDFASNLKSFPRRSVPLLHQAQALLSTALMPVGPAPVAKFVVVGGEEPAVLLESHLGESVGCREMGSVALNKTDRLFCVAQHRQGFTVMFLSS